MLKGSLSRSYLTRLPHSMSRSSLMLTYNTGHLWKSNFKYLCWFLLRWALQQWPIIWSFSSFYQRAGVKPKPSPTLGMDGPNVNLKFQQDLAKYFDEKGVLFLNIDTCLLHKVHGSFKHGVESLPIDID